jgi:hypothetical protein
MSLDGILPGVRPLTRRLNGYRSLIGFVTSGRQAAAARRLMRGVHGMQLRNGGFALSNFVGRLLRFVGVDAG